MLNVSIMFVSMTHEAMIFFPDSCMYAWSIHPWCMILDPDALCMYLLTTWMRAWFKYVWCTYPWSWSLTLMDVRMILVPDPDAPIHLWCMYLLTTWMHTWCKHGWRTYPWSWSLTLIQSFVHVQMCKYVSMVRQISSPTNQRTRVF